MNFVAESVHIIISHHKVSRSFMSNQLRLLLMMFYAPARALSEVRERAPLAFAAVCALVAQTAYALFTRWLIIKSTGVGLHGVSSTPSLLFQSAGTLLLIAIVFVPVTILAANLFERRGSFGLVVQQEYAALASTIFYSLAAANLAALPLALLANLSGVQAAYIANQLASAGQLRTWLKLPPEMQGLLTNPQFYAENLFRTIKLLLFCAWTIIAVRAVFRVSVWRAVAILLTGIIIVLVTTPVWGLLFSTVFASPFWLLMLYFLSRGYISEVTSTQRARASFKQNLEAATLNPADASAHYNLALIHQQRGELEAARERFQKAVDIDADETDSHYQLGRIARAQNKWPEAIEHFSKVVESDDAHAQHEIWREIGATYLAAGQYEDARDALEKFLARRTSDPEALYLMGRAHAGLGHQREAKSAMQACIEAVKSAPAYKYRAEKRWLNEALAFLRSQA